MQPAYAWLETRMAQAAEGERLAVVFDIDDTALSSLPAQQANAYGFFPEGSCDTLPKGPCGWTGWVAIEQAPALEPVLDLYERARELGYTVVFMSGRREAWRQSTANNLQAVGFSGWQQMILRPDDLQSTSAVDYKAPARAALEAQGYTIVLNIGDQASDLAGGHAERTVLLPNPFYRIP
jgi:acid phosphatase